MTSAHVEVVPGVADDRGNAGRSARCVNPDDLLAWHGEHAEGIVLAEVVLDGKRKLGEVVQRYQVGGSDPGVVEPRFVVRDIVVGVLQSRLEARQLESRDFVAAGDLDGIKFAGRRWLNGGVQS